METHDPRNLILGLSLGLIGGNDAVAWADNYILDSDNPPHWVLELALEDGKSVHDALKRIPGGLAAQPATDAQFLGAMAVRFLDRREPLTKILPLLYEKFCLCDWIEMTPFRQEIYLIDDELDWDPVRAQETASEALMKFLPEGYELLSRIKLSPAGQ